MGQKVNGQYFGIEYLSPEVQEFLVQKLRSLNILSTHGKISRLEEATWAVISFNGEKYGATSVSDGAAVLEAYLGMLNRIDGDIEKIINELERVKKSYIKTPEIGWQTLP